MKNLSIIALALFAAFKCSAQVTMPVVFSDNMVLQRDKPVSVWGKASPGEAVKIEFANQVKTTKADAGGNWQLTLKAMPASDQPKTMTVSGTNTIKFINILMGDVWLCSGQSNMDYKLDLKLAKHAPPKKGTDVSKDELAKSHPEPIRYFYARKSDTEKITNGWFNGNDSTLRYIATIGYFFAKEIYADTHVPIGIISSSWGGTRIEEWTPPQAYQQSALFTAQTQQPGFMIDGIVPGKKYQTMLEPVIPYTIKGTLWYQGEANAKDAEKANLYNEKFKLMIDWWRDKFNNKDMPFYYVQLAPYTVSKTAANQKAGAKQINDDFLAYFWEKQTNGLNIPNTGMAVVTDLVDEVKDIHPSYKWIVAHRLALIAEAKTYGHKSLEYSGPVYKSSQIKNGKVYLTFSHAQTGLKSVDGKPLNFFTIAGEDGKFVDAEANISGNQVVVSSPAVAQPKYVRFAWREDAMPNFFNTEGLPAVPFRTDNL